MFDMIQEPPKSSFETFVVTSVISFIRISEIAYSVPKWLYWDEKMHNLQKKGSIKEKEVPDNGRSRLIRDKAQERLKGLSFYTESEMPAPLNPPDVKEVNKTRFEINKNVLDVSMNPRRSVFSDNDEEGLRIPERRVLSVMSAAIADLGADGDQINKEEEKEHPLEYLRKMPKVINDKYVWETLSAEEKYQAFSEKN